jgi:heat shock protein HtpX
MNNIKTFLLMAALTALLVFVGGALAGRAGLLIALLLATVMNFSAYWNSDTMVLKAFKAQPLETTHPIYHLVRQLAEHAQTPTPKVYLIENPTPNAFATGRNPEHAAIAVTSGLLQRLNHEELAGVLGHEMSHIIHRDTLISTMSATIAGAISGIGTLFMRSGGANTAGGHPSRNPIAGVLTMILAPIGAAMIQMAISRSREFEADARGAKLCGNPLWLANALARLEQSNHQGTFRDAETHPASAHMFIINPLTGEKLSTLFRTHPLTSERIRRLETMAATTPPSREYS